MKSKHLRNLLILTVAAGMAGCNPLGKMIKKANTVSYETTPNPVEMHADSVTIDLKGRFPEKYFHKKAIVTVTPVLTRVEGGEVVKEFKPMTLLGELADGEGTKIKNAGGSFSYKDKLPYSKGMENAELKVKITGTYKGKSKDFPEVKAGDATNITPLLVKGDDKPLMGKDNFTKTVPRNHYSEINYLVNSSIVRPGELTDADIKELKKFLEEGVKKGLVFKGVDIEAYASPEGEISLNDNLANERAGSAGKYLEGELKKLKIPNDASFYNKVGKGEDWEGFKKMMQESSIKDKELILRVLQMYTDLNKREQEIKNMAATYVEVAEKILPKLRRSQINLRAEEKSKSDEEIKALASGKPDSLNVEELLYAATLTNDMGEKLKIYQACARVHANDWRGHNNAGYVQVLQNNLSEAKGNFEKASKLNDNAIVKNNLGVIARLNGDRKKAKELYSSATSAGSEVNYNLGIIAIQDGDYSSAVSNMGSFNTFNAALAKLLNGDPEGALKVVEASEDKSSAHGYYLKAIIGARTKNKDLLINNLKSAVSKDGSLREKARTDMEFIKFRDDSDFKGIVG